MTELELIATARTAGRTGSARAIRMAAGLTLRELARHLEVSSSSLSNYERGIGRPGPDLADRWLEASTR